MKKFLLIALGFAGIASTSVQAQSFTPQSDTVLVNYDINAGGNQEFHDNITNNTSSPITITWKGIANNLPGDWLVSPSSLGVCDNNNCYTGASAISGTTWTSNPYPAGPGGDFHLVLNASGGTNGTYYLTLNLTSGSTSKNVTFLMSKGTPASVGTVTKNIDDVQLYPNPARNNVNVVFDANAGVKYIAIYNIIGKQVSNFRINGGSAQLDVSDVPAGVYFVRLLDAQNRVLATRKFTHQ